MKWGEGIEGMMGSGHSLFWDFYCTAGKEEHSPPVNSGGGYWAAGAIAKRHLWGNSFPSSFHRKCRNSLFYLIPGFYFLKRMLIWNNLACLSILCVFLPEIISSVECSTVQD